ncbi:MAG: galactokinase [Spirochaetales bacterium]|nr:galactokinase [Spirochaetales bacterium]
MNIDMVISKTNDQRVKNLAIKFSKIFDETEVFVARSPGRTNLIGEHTDYNGCPVFPMAVDRDILAVCSPRDDKKVVIYDYNDAYGYKEFFIQKEIPSSATGDWGNYPKAAVQGLINYYAQTGKIKFDNLNGFNAVITSNIPAAGGMSSSSAFVVLSALLLLGANNINEDKKLLASLMAKSETYVGTQGGGMDQAACLMGLNNHALKIDFNPLRVREVIIPSGYCIVVADTLKKAPKTESALQNYNRRSIECKIATALIKKAFEKEYERIFPITALGDITCERLGLSEAEIDKVLDSALHKNFYYLDEIASILKLSPDAVIQKYCKMKDGQYLDMPPEGFKLYQRFYHVMTEWKRVEKSVLALESGNVKKFGQLMNDSHFSCRDNHEVSCKELDVLTEIARNAGALGSRMTGAGFGGCTVSLIKIDKVMTFIEKVKAKYYDSYLVNNAPELLKNASGDPIFMVYPADGAGIIKGFELE